MKKYDIKLWGDIPFCEIEAENESKAIDKAFEYWENFKPWFTITEIEEIKIEG